MANKNYAGRGTAVVGATILLVGMGVAADKVVSMSEVPAAVQSTIKEHTIGAQTQKVELENEDGKQIYSVEFMKDGKETEIEIAADGKFIKEESEEHGEKGEHEDGDKEDDDEQVVDPATAPAAVANALKPICKRAPIKEMTKETEHGKVVYEAKFEIDGKEHSASVTADGSVLETEMSIMPAALPQPVSAAIKQKYPSGKVTKAEESNKTINGAQHKSYEVQIEAEGKMRKMALDAAGKPVKDDED